MNISGSGRISAGEYNEKISVSGSGKLDGNIRCTSLSCSGAVKGTGSVSCFEDIRISGSCKIEHEASAANISVSGATKVGGNITAEKEIKISGALKGGGDLKCNLLRCSGGLDIDGEIEAEEIKISGRVNCRGLMNAERIDISIESFTGGKIGSIGGGEILIQKKNSGRGVISRLPLISSILGKRENGNLTVDQLIEGDVIALECVNVPKVVGRIVAIGAGCEIKLVQYIEKIEIHPDAKVEQSEKI